MDDARWQAFSRKREAIEAERARLESMRLKPAQLAAPEFTEVFGPAPESSGANGLDLLRRPEGGSAVLKRLGLIPADLDPVVSEQVEIQARYAGYIDRQQAEIERARRHEEAPLPTDLDYAVVSGLSNEARQKLAAHRPETVAQAARISGITPAAVSLLLIHLKKIGRLRKSA